MAFVELQRNDLGRPVGDWARWTDDRLDPKDKRMCQAVLAAECKAHHLDPAAHVLLVRKTAREGWTEHRL